jgi:hypothetical protein
VAEASTPPRQGPPAYTSPRSYTPKHLGEKILTFGQLTPNDEADNGGWFSRLPELMHADQAAFLMANGYLR